MYKQIVFIIIIAILVILSITNIYEDFFGGNSEGFSVESNCNPENIYRDDVSKLDRRKDFMLRDIKTRYWLIINSGIGKFAAGDFGVPIALSENPNEYLPLRLSNQPNTYMIAGYTGDGLRAVSNPYTNFFKIEVMIHNQRNILAYEDEKNVQHFIVVEPSGYSTSTTNPDEASTFEMLFVQ